MNPGSAQVEETRAMSLQPCLRKKNGASQGGAADVALVAATAAAQAAARAAAEMFLSSDRSGHFDQGQLSAIIAATAAAAAAAAISAASTTRAKGTRGSRAKSSRVPSVAAGHVPCVARGQVEEAFLEASRLVPEPVSAPENFRDFTRVDSQVATGCLGIGGLSRLARAARVSSVGLSQDKTSKTRGSGGLRHFLPSLENVPVLAPSPSAPRGSTVFSDTIGGHDGEKSPHLTGGFGSSRSVLQSRRPEGGSFLLGFLVGGRSRARRLRRGVNRCSRYSDAGASGKEAGGAPANMATSQDLIQASRFRRAKSSDPSQEQLKHLVESVNVRAVGKFLLLGRRSRKVPGAFPRPAVPSSRAAAGTSQEASQSSKGGKASRPAAMGDRCDGGTKGASQGDSCDTVHTADAQWTGTQNFRSWGPARDSNDLLDSASVHSAWTEARAKQHVHEWLWNSSSTDSSSASGGHDSETSVAEGRECPGERLPPALEEGSFPEESKAVSGGQRYRGRDIILAESFFTGVIDAPTPSEDSDPSSLVQAPLASPGVQLPQLLHNSIQMSTLEPKFRRPHTPDPPVAMLMSSNVEPGAERCQSKGADDAILCTLDLPHCCTDNLHRQDVPCSEAEEATSLHFLWRREAPAQGSFIPPKDSPGLQVCDLAAPEGVADVASPPLPPPTSAASQDADTGHAEWLPPCTSDVSRVEASLEGDGALAPVRRRKKSKEGKVKEEKGTRKRETGQDKTDDVSKKAKEGKVNKDKVTRKKERRRQLKQTSDTEDESTSAVSAAFRSLGNSRSLRMTATAAFLEGDADVARGSTEVAGRDVPGRDSWHSLSRIQQSTGFDWNVEEACFGAIPEVSEDPWLVLLASAETTGHRAGHSLNRESAGLNTAAAQLGTWQVQQMLLQQHIWSLGESTTAGG